ncbi:MAG: phospholipid carrier-dependent glycosyltransferase, partial [Candidatus Gastranaerophilales bacterium]|nr:phospholipid carrier-dependent glycosyltransferase [Candidatus Gastranaerophilales bacterium]
MQLHVNLHNNFYRPLQQLSHGIIYQFFGLKVQAYHILSILLHITNSFLVFLLLKRLSFSRIASFLAALIFLVHPVQIEAVSYISGVSDPLSFMFMISGILVYLNCYDPENKVKTILKTSLAAILFIIALLSKESAVIFCLLVGLLSIFLWKNYSKEERLFRIKNLVFYLILAGIYVYLRFTVLNFSK